MDAPAPRTLSPSHTLRGHEDAVWDCAVAVDGLVAISCGEKGAALIWDLSGSGTMRATLRGYTSHIWRCALSADGSVAATASSGGSGGGNVHVWDAQSGRRQRVLRRDGFDIGGGCALSADGGLLIASFCNQDKSMGQVMFYDWRSDRIVDEVTRSCAVVYVSTSWDGTQVALMLCDSTSTLKVEIMDRRRGLSRVISCNGDAHAAMTYFGSHAAIADQRQLRLLDVQGHGEPTVMQGYQCGVDVWCAVTANASRVVVTSPDNSYSVWDTTTRSVVATLRGHTDVTRGCAMSAFGSHIITCSEDRTVRVWPMSITTAVNPSPTLESPPTAVKSRAHSQHRINPDTRYDLFISVLGNEIICPGMSTRDVARETRDQTLEKSGGLASVFFDEECMRGCRDEQRFEAIMQTRGGGTVLFLLTKYFFNTRWCRKELRKILRIHARGKETGSGEKFKLRFVCFGSSADEILVFAKDTEPQIEGYVIECIPLTTLEDMGSAIASVVDGAWREYPPTMFGDSALVSFMLLANMFRDDVAVASVLLQVPGEDIITVVRNAMQGPNLGLYNVELLKRVAALSTNKMGAREKVKSVKTYTAKWIDSRRWSWSAAGGMGTETLAPE